MKKADKKAFPRDLDSALRETDLVVKSHHEDVIAKHSGYLETLQDILGEDMKVGIVKIAVNRLRYKDIVEAAKLEMEKWMTVLSDFIQCNVTEAPSEEEQIAAAERDWKRKSTSNSSIADGDGNSSEGVKNAKTKKSSNSVPDLSFDASAVPIYSKMCKYCCRYCIFLIYSSCVYTI